MSLFARRVRAIGLVAAVAGAIAIAPLATAPAFADGGGSGGSLGYQALQFCKSIQGFYPASNMIGPCESYFVSHYGSDGLPAAQSATDRFFCQIDLVPNGVFSSVGACVSGLKQAQGLA
jgi:hypothetical protein